MLTSSDILTFLAAWELVHESADEGLKAAIARGATLDDVAVTSDKGAFVDGLAAVIDARKEVLKAALISNGEPTDASQRPDSTAALTELRNEVAVLRGRLESMNTTLDALAAKLLDW